MFSQLSNIMKFGEYAVLVILVILSVASLAIMFEKFLFLRKYANKIDFENSLKDLKTSSAATLPQQTLALLQKNSKSIDQLQLAYRDFTIAERMRLEKGLNFLATLGSNAPFIGLLGTVLGIIEAFSALSNSQSGSQAVMAGISQALVATAVGLFVAIPAVIAFNVFSNQIRKALLQCERLRETFIIQHFYS